MIKEAMKEQGAAHLPRLRQRKINARPPMCKIPKYNTTVIRLLMVEYTPGNNGMNKLANLPEQ